MSSKKTTRAARDWLCAHNATQRLYSLAAPLICGDTSDGLTPLKSSRSSSNPAELFLHIPQMSHLYTPSKGRSEIWKYFKLKEDDESHKKWAVCNKCPKSILFVGATSNLWGHMRVVHSIENKRSSQ